MKISSIGSVKTSNNNQKQTNRPALPYQAQQQNFTGFTDGLVGFWELVDKGGRAVQFTIEDMLGTNFPRTYKGAMAGYKYTGKINKKALIQEGLREFLTGPIMTLCPLAIISISKAKMGKSANTHVENIKNLSFIAQEAANAKGDLSQLDFFEAIAKDALKNTIGEGEFSDEAKELAKGIQDYSQIKILNQAGQIDKKATKKAMGEALGKLQEQFSAIVKKNKKDFTGTDFLNATYSITKDQKGSLNFKQYIQYADAYAKDISKTSSNGLIAKDKIQGFMKSWTNKRLAIIGAMVGLTGILMYIIPKVYTYFSCFVNPNASAIYDEAEGKNQKIKKEVK